MCKQCPQEPEEGSGAPRMGVIELGATIWVPGIEPRSLGRAKEEPSVSRASLFLTGQDGAQASIVMKNADSGSIC